MFKSIRNITCLLLFPLCLLSLIYTLGGRDITFYKLYTNFANLDLINPYTYWFDFVNAMDLWIKNWDSVFSHNAFINTLNILKQFYTMFYNLGLLIKGFIEVVYALGYNALQLLKFIFGMI